MKKLYAILFVACALYTTSALAKDYVVKYDNETGEIKAWGAMSGLKKEPGETIISTNVQIYDSKEFIVKDGSVVEKTALEKKADKDAIKAEKQARKSRKQALFLKMGLDQSDISALKEFLQDGNEE